MIGIQNQYKLIFTIGKKSDFIRETELIQFHLIEEAGNVLPTFLLEFSTNDDGILPLLNETNPIKVSFGRDDNGLTDSLLMVTRVWPTKLGEGKRKIKAIGIYFAPGYMSNDRSYISSKVSGVEAIKEVTTKYFKPVFNISKSEDSQYWIQPSISDRKFINQVWLHSYLQNSFIATAITSDGRFILKDMKKDLAQPVDWNFTKSIKNENKDIAYDNDYNLDINTGFVNTWLGYGREKLIYGMEDGSDQYVTESPEPMVSLTSKLARSAQVEARFSASGFSNDNVHENYHRAALKNVTRLSAFGAVRLTLSFQGKYAPIKVLDKVMFKDDDVASLQNESSEYVSGIYYIAKVARGVSARTHTTTVTLCRESLNSVQTASS